MAEPFRDQVVEAIVDRLKGISANSAPVPGGTNYWTTPAQVTRVYALPQQFNEFPVLIVVSGGGSLLRRSIQDQWQHDFRVVIYGHVLADSLVGRDRALLRLHEDVARCLAADPTLGGLVMRMTDFGEDDNDEGIWEPYGGFVQPVTYIFHETFPEAA